MTKLHLILITCFVSLFLTDNFSQVSDTTGVGTTVPTLPGDEVTVIKDFQARLAESQRIKILPALPVFETKILQYYYDVNVRGLALDYPPLVIKPVAIDPFEVEKSYLGQFRFAYGYPRFSLADVNLSKQLTKNLKVGLAYEHMAARNKERIPSRFNRHLGKLHAEYRISDIAQVEAGFRTHYDIRDILNSNLAIETGRIVREFGGHINVLNPASADSKFDYLLGLNLYNLGISDLERSENGFGIDLGLSKRFGSIKAGLDFDYDRIGTNIDSSATLGSLRLQPKVSYNTSTWNVLAGAHFLFENGQNFVYPELKISRVILADKLQVALVADTDFRVNSYKNTLAFNPYLANIDTIRNEKIMNFGAEAKGTAAGWEYGLAAGYRLINSKLNYTLIENLEGDQNILWNANSVNATSPYLEVYGAYQIIPMLKLSGKILYQDFKNQESEALFGYYKFRLGTNLQISLLEDKLKIIPGIDIYSNLERDIELDERRFSDLHIDIEYKVAKRFSLFINADNLLNSKNQRWNNYSAVGIAANGGLKVLL
ncbi:hypothetical protein N9B82_02495 [Saprospiraceae bacterium]|nr:hypothetical protein [Saprospiraceae bacterium]